ncbi:MAG: hypothetical protein PHC34_00535 [Candidatus Gastranaerophilales bacterium]|nr:hypothetical protein [Candidatus Gastranaerophilales bacterium]
MSEDDSIKRWYDNDLSMNRVLNLMKNLPEHIQEELAVTLIQFANLIRKNRKIEENALSIGTSKVLGLYKASNKRRWYDKNPTLMSAMNILNTLPPKEFKNIVEGLLLTLTNTTGEK